MILRVLRVFGICIYTNIVYIVRLNSRKFTITKRMLYIWICNVHKVTIIKYDIYFLYWINAKMFQIYV